MWFAYIETITMKVCFLCTWPSRTHTHTCTSSSQMNLFSVAFYLFLKNHLCSSSSLHHYGPCIRFCLSSAIATPFPWILSLPEAKTLVVGAREREPQPPSPFLFPSSRPHIHLDESEASCFSSDLLASVPKPISSLYAAMPRVVYLVFLWIVAYPFLLGPLRQTFTICFLNNVRRRKQNRGARGNLCYIFIVSRLFPGRNKPC